MIARLSEVAALDQPLVGNNFQQILWKFQFQWTKNLLSRPDIYKAFKPFLTLEQNQYCKSGSMFSSSVPAATAADSETPCVCARLSYLRKQCQSAAPRAWPLVLPSKPSIVLEQPLGVIARWPAGAQTWTQTWTLLPDQRAVKVLSALKSQNKLCGVWILFRCVKKAEIEDIAETISTLIPPTAVD